MGKRDPRIDTIIEAAPPFAEPILRKLRGWIHKHCPAADEAVKWGHVSFLYNKKILCGVGTFKAHCTFGFWHPLMRGKERGEVMAQFGRLTSVKDLPPEAEFSKLVRRAMKIEDDGLKAPVVKKKPKPSLVVPDDLVALLGKNAKAQKTFEALSPSHRREYIEWISEAKRPETRERRLLTTLEWLAEGKSRNWSYERR